jgi:hypothetical protein
MMPKKKKPDPRSDKLPSGKGTAGKAKTRPLTESLDLPRPSEEALDERQRRIGEYRKPRTGTHAPNDGKWGDYVACRRDAPDADQWVAVGFTLQGGGARTDIEPILVQFRR